MANLNKTKKALKLAKIEFVKMLKPEVLVGFFNKQARTAAKNGATTGPTPKQVKRYARACYKSLAQVVSDCTTPDDFESMGAHLSARLDPRSLDFLNALAY